MTEPRTPAHRAPAHLADDAPTLTVFAWITCLFCLAVVGAVGPAPLARAALRGLVLAAGAVGVGPYASTWGW